MGSGGPLTLGTAGHVDHGKTTLVAALTGVETDRLPEERARGLTIALGYAPLRLPSGRELSLVDVPGHERFVRTMVSGASGVDLWLMTVAADDGVMPQTREHAEVLRALDVRAGVVAVTKADLADPSRAAEEARELLPEAAAVVPVSARTGFGLDALRAALDAVAASQGSRAEAEGPALLHVDRVFTVVGRGTVVTGTLWSGAIALGDELEIAPRGVTARVRGLEIHDRPVARAAAGQRVAVNLAGVRVAEIARGDALATPGALTPTTILDCALTLRDAAHGERVQVHHGTRDAPGRLAALEGDLWQVRLERPLLARAGDRLVIRRLAPPDTLGGGVVLDPAAGRHGRRPEILARLRALRDGASDPALDTAAPAAPAPAAAPPPLDPAARALAERLREAGAGWLSEAQLADERAALRALREAGVAVRVSGRLYGDAAVVAAYAARVVALLERDGEVRLAGVRDALGIGRKSAQALLEHLDATGVTRRLDDDRRVPRRREPIA